jgi:hypothetical protein
MTLRECRVDHPFPYHIFRCWVRIRPPPRSMGFGSPIEPISADSLINRPILMKFPKNPPLDVIRTLQFFNLLNKLINK